MATLTGVSISSSYTSLLKLDGNTDSTAAGNGSNAIQVKTGDNDATPLFLNTDRLGIGVQPTKTLTVQGASGQIANITNGTNNLVMYVDNSNVQIANNTDLSGAEKINMSVANQAIEFYQNGSEKMRLDSTGLGIGTATVDTNLHVYENAGSDTEIKVENIHSGGSAIFRAVSHTGRFAQILFGDTADESRSRIAYDNTNDRLLFRTNGVSDNALVIDSSQNVSIGATNKLFFDGGNNTYISETSGDILKVFVNDAICGTFRDSGFAIEPTSKLWFDGAGDTYIHEQSANKLDFFVGNGTRFVLDANSRISLSNNDAGGTGGQNSTSSNTIIGYKAGNAVASGTINNTFIGHNAGLSANDAVANVVVGTNSADALTTGDHNVALGYFALSASTDVDSAIAIGSGAMESGNVTSDADGSIAIGRNSLLALTSGARNVAIGFESGKAMTTASKNAIVGYQAGLAIINAGENAILGDGAGASITDHGRNVFVGHNAGANQEGETNVFIGKDAGLGSSGSDNDGTVAVGFNSLQALTTGAGNVAVGYQSLDEITTGANNTVVGYGAMGNADNDESHNVCVGNLAGDDLDGGDQNVVIGSLADAKATGQNQTVIGYNAQAGSLADNSVTLGNADVTDVYMAQDSGATIHASNGVFIDDTPFITVRDSSSYSAGTGGGVAFQGNDSDGNLKQFSSIQGYSIGSNNGGLAIFTRDGGSNNLAVIVDNNRALKPGVNDAYDIGTSSLRWDDIFATNGTIDTSDERRKENIKDTSLGLDFVNKLKPKEYKWKDYDYEHIDNQDGEEPKSITKTRTFKRKHQGLLAQDVEKTLKDIGLTNDDFAGIVYDKESDIYGLRYSQLIAPLIKAVQELSAKVTELENK